MQRDDGGLAFAVGARDPVIARFQIGVFFSELLPMLQQDGRTEARGVRCELDIIFSGGHARQILWQRIGLCSKRSMQPRTISRYRVGRLIGAGGMGEVYLAEDETLNRKVALKLLPVRFTRDEERVRRFQREARAASALNHPNIITIYEIGHADSVHYIATEYIEGETLRERWPNGGSMPAKCSTSPSASPARSPPRTTPASSTATSSRKTSCCGPTAT